MKNRTTLFTAIYILFLSSFASAQELTQTIKGRVVDAQTKSPLIGATIIVEGSDPAIGAVSDPEGYYYIRKVPIGRVSLNVNYIGYHAQRMNNLNLTSGKELVVNVELEEMVTKLSEITISASGDKGEVNNEFALVSARTFDIEETSRYAGSRNDPARMAANFAGVSGANDARNDIIIRGNSPSGLLWRLEGIDIPSPNHFSALGTTGGPVSMLNNNVLGKSDFMTAAFPSQYGNALAGVFDLQLRKGNSDKREYLGQIGFNGFEFGAEGPLSKNSRASYLANYRYSTLGVFKALGMNFGTGAAIPEYQDLSFKVDLPTEKAGKFSVFGLGGTSGIELLGSKSDGSNDLYGNSDYDIVNKTRTGVAGMSHTYYFNQNTYSHAVIAVTHSKQLAIQDSLSSENRLPHRNYEMNFIQNKIAGNFSINKKLNVRNSFTIGTIVEYYDLSLADSIYTASGFRILRNVKGGNFLSQVYTNWQHRFNDKLVVNSGLHFQHFDLNNSTAAEPRLGVRYLLKPGKSLNFGYGLHSQLQPLQNYFVETRQPDGSYVRTNTNLNFVRSNHLVTGYEQKFGNNIRFKTEAYYQYLFNVAVESTPSSFSMLNAGADFGIPSVDNLVNEGTGYNYGLEFTLEKYFSNHHYFLVTASFFESKYRGSDNILRNTAFNGNYVVNLLGGKEFVFNKNKILSVDFNVTAAGGRRVSPIDLERSIAFRQIRYDHANAFSLQMKDYFRTDMKVSYRLNKRKLTHEWAIDIQNVFNNQNEFIQNFNPGTNEIETIYQLGIFPIPQYRITF